MSTERICPSCRKPLPAEAPQELCPECLMKAGFPSNPGGPQGSSKFVPPPVAELAKLFPQLEVMELIGQGGMGAVYRARQPGLDRLVALKILPPESTQDPGFTERFAREARALAKLNHPNIVSIYDFGQMGGLHYFLMEFVDGLNLRQLSLGSGISTREALQIVQQMCDALQFAHDEGIVHRDIKPENVMIDKRGRVKITDFGLAKLLGHEPENPHLTGARDVMGTPHYMAPEQMDKPQAVDHRADIYSLGVVFYELLTGELPIGKFAPPSRKVSVDVRLDDVVLHTLEREPARRYQHASEVKSDVQTITQTPAATANASAPPLQETAWLADARSSVSGPATGLVVTAILNWVAIPLFLLVALYIGRAHDGGMTLLVLLPLSALVISSVILIGGLLMKQLRGYWFAVVASILAILVTPGSIIGLPIGIWSLVVLSHKRVRESFGKELPSLMQVHAATPRSGGGWKVAAVIVGGVMLMGAIPLLLLIAAITLPAAHRAKAAAQRQQALAREAFERQKLAVAADAPHHGPVTEITLRSFEAVDLDAAQVLSRPDQVEQESTGETVRWMKDKGADLLIGFAGGSWLLYTPEANELRLSVVDDSAWFEQWRGTKALPVQEVFDATLKTNGAVMRPLSSNAVPPFTFTFDVRNNPGYLAYQNGFPISFQWLNYWHDPLADRLIGARRTLLKRLVDVTRLNSPAGLRVRVSAEPWSYNDASAHQTQLQCRKVMGWL